ncbi:MAG: NAD(P)H-dependent oxidoreductase [bacterium]
MNIYILQANTDKTSFGSAIADIYEQTAIKLGHIVRRQNLGDIQFDPILWAGFKQEQPLEKDLIEAQKIISWCNHWVIIYPVWWGNVPAILKGFFDRILTPGFAFKYHKNDPMWDRLLAGKTGHVITTCDSPGIWLALQNRNSDLNAVVKATLNFCGISSVKVTRFTQVRKADKTKLGQWLLQVSKSVPKI